MISRKIETRERAEVLLGGFIVGPRRFNLSFKERVVLLSAVANIHFPRASATVGYAHNTLVNRGPTGALSLIPQIFSLGANAKVASAIIKCVAIDVIHDNANLSANNQPMERNNLSANSPPRVPVSISISACGPRVRRKPLSVGRIHQGKFAFCKR